MKLLAIDTSTSRQSVALLEGKRVIGCSEIEARGEHTKKIIPAIHELLEERHETLADLEGLAVAIGPGSFTGLRVGLATMLGLRSVSQLPLAAVPTLEAMVWSLPTAKKPLCPMINGRTGEVYWGLYQWKEGVVVQLSPDRVGPFQDVIGSITESTVCFGEGWAAYRDSLLETLHGHVCEVPDADLAPAAVNVGLAGIARLTAGDVASVGVAPRYVQRAEAEILWEQRGAIPKKTIQRFRKKSIPQSTKE